MYSDEEKKRLMDDLLEMEEFKPDTGDEGKILQDDLEKYFTTGNGDKEDLISRIELYLYEFRLLCRKPVKIDRNQFIVYLNSSLLYWDKIELVKNDFDKFELEIEAVSENKDSLINLTFTLHY